MGYKIGQILFVIPAEKQAVVPIQIVEEITKKTLDGEVVSYIVRYGQDPQKQADISKIGGEIYESADRVAATLFERANNGITQLVNTAIEKANTWYSGGFESINQDDQSLSIVPNDERTRDEKGRFVPSAADHENGTTVELPDGTIAKVRMPAELQG